MKKTSVAARVSMLVAAAALAAPLAASAQNVAIVNGKAVPKARVDALLGQAIKSGQQRTPQLEQQVRDEVVMREIFMQEAERRGLAATPEYKQQMELARQSILIRELISQAQAKHPVTDAEVAAEYEKVKTEAGGGGNEYHARHILVEQEDQAKSIIVELKGGAKFDELAKKYSKDTGSAENGGDLDWAAPNAYVPEFSQAMVKLQKGQVTDTPVKSQFGWHVILLEDTRAAQFPPLEEVRAQIQQRLTQQRMSDFRDELRAKAKTDYKFSQ